MLLLQVHMHKAVQRLIARDGIRDGLCLRVQMEWSHPPVSQRSASKYITLNPRRRNNSPATCAALHAPAPTDLLLPALHPDHSNAVTSALYSEFPLLLL